MILPQRPFPCFHWYDDIRRDIKTSGKGLWIYVALQIGLGIFTGVAALFSEGLVEFAFLMVTILSALGTIFYLNHKFKIKYNIHSAFCLKEIVQGFSLMLLVSFIWGIITVFIDMILYRLGLSELSQDIAYGNDTFGNIFLFLSVVVAAPIGEEFVFRGLIFKRLSKYHVGFAMVVSSLCFAMMHMNVVQGIPTFFMGMILAYFYWKTNSLKTSIGIHFLNNLFAMVSMSVNVGILPIGFDIFGIYLLIKHRKAIIRFIREERVPKLYFSYFFKSPSIICFIVMFFVMAGLSLL